MSAVANETVPLASTSRAGELPAGTANGRPPRRRVQRFGAAPSPVVRTVILVLAGILFVGPILAMLEFTFRIGLTGHYGFVHYLAFLHPDGTVDYSPLFQGIINSLTICVITVAIVLVILLPTMLLVELRYPRMRRILEFVCILPITIPSIVLVVGFVPVYRTVASIFGSQAWTLAFAVGIIVLPYAFRPIATNIAAFDLVTLSEAARSLGASWPRVILRVILPNLRRGIVSAIFLTIAVVLGEYTIASFLSQNTFQTALVLLQHGDPYVATIFAVAALLFAFVLLIVIGRLGTGGRKSRKAS